MSEQPVLDLLLEPEWILPVESREPLRDHVLAVREGRIEALAPLEEMRHRRARKHLRLPGRVLFPGLVNAHTHAAMCLLRGLADDLPLRPWLEEHIWPTEQRWVSPEFVAAGSRLAVAEMIRSGTTCFNDMYFFPDETARVAARAGLRAVLGLLLVDFPSAWASGVEQYLERARDVHAELHGSALLSCTSAPHAPYTVGDDSLRRMRALAEELDLPLHMHVQETATEVADSLRIHGRRPLTRLDDLGLVDQRLLAVHATQLEDQEIELLAARGAHVLHCPESNLKLASGACPVQRLLEAGVNVALGTDGAASNNDLNLLGEARSAALLAKWREQDSSALPAAQVLEAATLGGARALGLDREIGSLVPGKQADLVIADLRRPETQPVYDPCSQLIYACDRSQVSHVWVAGRLLLEEGRLLTLDLEDILQEARGWGGRIAAARERPFPGQAV